MKIIKSKYNALLKSISTKIQDARKTTANAKNVELVKANLKIGRHFIEFERHGEERAEYEKAFLTRISRDLQKIYGAGFGRHNLQDMRRFYLTYSKWQTVSAKFCCSHYIALMSISDTSARKFYEKQCLIENWSVQDLEKQINSSLFERIALSRDKNGILQLLKKGNVIKKVDHVIRNPYIFIFLQIPKDYRLTEKNLKQKLITNIQLFLLELGKGFTFVARQYKLSL